VYNGTKNLCIKTPSNQSLQVIAATRLHLTSSGHPLAVDKEYTRTEALYLSELKTNYKSSGKEKPLIGRLSLHSASITFKEPETQKDLTVEAPLPDDFELTLKQLRKYNT